MLLSVLWLGEQVGPRRWLTLGVGFLGVLLIVKPGSAAFNPGSVYALLAMLTYALSVMITRRLQTTGSSATMAYFSSLVYLVAALVLAPLVGVVGEQPGADASLALLFRAWSRPTLLDATIMAGLGHSEGWVRNSWTLDEAAGPPDHQAGARAGDQLLRHGQRLRDRGQRSHPRPGPERLRQTR